MSVPGAPPKNVLTGMVETPAGLVVPEAAVERRQRTLLTDRFQAMRRFLKAMKSEGIGVLLACPKCGTQIQVKVQNRIIDVEAGGEPMLACRCTDWAIRG